MGRGHAFGKWTQSIEKDAKVLGVTEEEEADVCEIEPRTRSPVNGEARTGGRIHVRASPSVPKKTWRSFNSGAPREFCPGQHGAVTVKRDPSTSAVDVLNLFVCPVVMMVAVFCRGE
ncbi:unnamed protein product [Pleuronectes platessa]|uniref:Uncharacterized protein n=1 Tax=Pleuronectes platessa TaxID=8262 RepID=A0A9N7UA10_PLEPL|nr:unnamed protein product [Pleuronectes platessa]